MYILKVDKNEFTKDGVKKELWGYSLYNGTTCIKSETIKARIRDTDTRVMRYVRCYTWALERILGYFSVNEVLSNEFSIYFTNTNVINWIQYGDVNKVYRIAMDKIMGYIDAIPVESVKICKANRDWAFRKTITEGKIEDNNYIRLIDLITSVGV